MRGFEKRHEQQLKAFWLNPRCWEIDMEITTLLSQATRTNLIWAKQEPANGPSTSYKSKVFLSNLALSVYNCVKFIVRTWKRKTYFSRRNIRWPFHSKQCWPWSCRAYFISCFMWHATFGKSVFKPSCLTTTRHDCSNVTDLCSVLSRQYDGHLTAAHLNSLGHAKNAHRGECPSSKILRSFVNI